MGEQIGGHGVRLGVFRVQRKCLSDACRGSTQRVVERLLAEQLGPRTHQRSPGIARGFPPRTRTHYFGDEKPRRQPSNCFVQDPIAQRRLIIGTAFDLIGPDMQSGASVDEPQVATYRPAGTDDAAFNEVADAELCGDQPRINRGIAIGRGGMS